MSGTFPPYGSYTYAHPHVLVRYPHRKRLALLARFIGRAAPKRWLDYGAGDGEVYRFHEEQGGAVDEAVLYEPVEELYEQAIEKLGGRSGSGFAIVTALGEIEGRFDLITAFEVLEHLPLPERVTFFRMAARHLAPGGRILIEVPIEYGPILLLKEFGRQFLKDRGQSYGMKELLSTALLGRVEDAEDRYNPADERQSINLHHGFDIHRFEQELSQLGSIAWTATSPFPRLPAWLNQCRLYELTLQVRDPDEITERMLGLVSEAEGGGGGGRTRART